VSVPVGVTVSLMVMDSVSVLVNDFRNVSLMVMDSGSGAGAGLNATTTKAAFFVAALDQPVAVDPGVATDNVAPSPATASDSAHCSVCPF